MFVYTNKDETVVTQSQNMPVNNVLAARLEEHGENTSSLTQKDQQQLAAWNSTQQYYPRNACVPQLVAVQADIAPCAVALVADDQVLSYRELNQRANQLAHYLQTLGVRPNVLVG